MVMATLFHKTNQTFEVAHVNYKLRGDDSEKDMILVENWCKSHNIPFHLYEVSGKDQKPENSVQVWARELRYQFFTEILTERKLDLIVTAHHLNDQLETFLINLSKASGLKGLSGIPERTEKIVRPLLSFNKEEIYGFAETKRIAFREDVSNKKDDYLRNRIRHNVVPELLKLNPNFLDNFNKSVEILNDTKDFVEEKLAEEFDSVTEKSGASFKIDRALANKSRLIQFEIFNKYGFSAAEIPKIFQAEKGKTFFSTEFKLTVDRSFFLIEKRDTAEIQADSITVAEEFCAEINLSEFTESTDEKIWHIASEKITFPLRLRKKQDGDQFFPTGMTGRKKVSKFFKDEKISILAMQKTWLLVDAKDQILGVVPLRQDRRTIATEATKNVIKVKL